MMARLIPEISILTLCVLLNFLVPNSRCSELSLSEAVQAAQSTGLGQLVAGWHEGTKNCGVQLQLTGVLFGREIQISGAEGNSQAPIWNAQKRAFVLSTIVACPNQRALTVTCGDMHKGCGKIVLRQISFIGGSPPELHGGFGATLLSWGMRQQKTFPQQKAVDTSHQPIERKKTITDQPLRDSHVVYPKFFQHGSLKHAEKQKQKSIPNRPQPEWWYLPDSGDLYSKSITAPADEHSMHMDARGRFPCPSKSEVLQSAGGAVLIFGNMSAEIVNVGVNHAASTWGGGIAIVNEGVGGRSLSTKVIGVAAYNCSAQQGGGLYIWTAYPSDVSQSKFVSCKAMASGPSVMTADFMFDSQANASAGAAAFLSSAGQVFDIEAKKSVSFAIDHSNKPMGQDEKVISLGSILVAFAGPKSKIQNLTFEHNCVTCSAFRNSNSSCAAFAGDIAIFSAFEASISSVRSLNASAKCYADHCYSVGASVLVHTTFSVSIFDLTMTQISVYCQGNNCVADSGALSIQYGTALQVRNVVVRSPISRCSAQGKGCVVISSTMAVARMQNSRVSAVQVYNATCLSDGSITATFGCALFHIRSGSCQFSNWTISGMSIISRGTGPVPDSQKGPSAVVQGGLFFITESSEIEGVRATNVSIHSFGSSSAAVFGGYLFSGPLQSGPQNAERCSKVDRDHSVLLQSHMLVNVKVKSALIQGSLINSNSGNLTAIGMLIQDVHSVVLPFSAGQLQGSLLFCVASGVSLSDIRTVANSLSLSAGEAMIQGGILAIMPKCSLYMKQSNITVSETFWEYTGALIRSSGASRSLASKALPYKFSIGGLGSIFGGLAVHDSTFVVDIKNFMGKFGLVVGTESDAGSFLVYNTSIQSRVSKGGPATETCSRHSDRYGRDLLTVGPVVVCADALSQFSALSCGVPVMQSFQTLPINDDEIFSASVDKNIKGLDSCLSMGLQDWVTSMRCSKGQYPTTSRFDESLRGEKVGCESRQWPYTPTVEAESFRVHLESVICSHCPDGFYSLSEIPVVSGNLSACLLCPLGGICPGQGELNASVNHWGYIMKPSADSEQSISARFELCPGGFCNPVSSVWDDVDRRCGVNRQGILCGECSPGTGRQFLFTDCIDAQRCARSQAFAWPLVFFACLIYAIVVSRPVKELQKLPREAQQVGELGTFNVKGAASHDRQMVDIPGLHDWIEPESENSPSERNNSDANSIGVARPENNCAIEMPWDQVLFQVLIPFYQTISLVLQSYDFDHLEAGLAAVVAVPLSLAWMSPRASTKSSTVGSNAQPSVGLCLVAGSSEFGILMQRVLIMACCLAMTAVVLFFRATVWRVIAVRQKSSLTFESAGCQLTESGSKSEAAPTYAVLNHVPLQESDQAQHENHCAQAHNISRQEELASPDSAEKGLSGRLFSLLGRPTIYSRRTRSSGNNPPKRSQLLHTWVWNASHTGWRKLAVQMHLPLSTGSSITKIVLTLTTGMVEVCVRLLTCRHLPGLCGSEIQEYAGDSCHTSASAWRWWYDGSQNCFGVRFALAAVFLCFLLATPAGLLFRSQMWLKADRRCKRWELSGLPIYAGLYKSSCTHWAIVSLYQRFLLVLVVFLPPDPMVRSGLACLILMAFTALDLVYGPFSKWGVRISQRVALSSATVVALFRIRGAVLLSMSIDPHQYNISTQFDRAESAVILLALAIPVATVFLLRWYYLSSSNHAKGCVAGEKYGACH